MSASQVWSCGGGTQSAAIAALIVHGLLPKPDHSLIVDTKRERASTWQYVDGVLRPALAAVGVDLVRVDRDDYTDIDLYGGEDGKSLLLPMFTAPAGKMPAFCSGEWKREVASRYMRKTLGLRDVVNWIGYSTDEMRRVSTARKKWLQLRYPLITDFPASRERCVAIVRAMGWPEPPRSSCWMCPHHSDSEWREMAARYPEDFAKAIAIEADVRSRDDGVYLHPSRKPLAEIDLTEPAGLWGGSECVGECFT